MLFTSLVALTSSSILSASASYSSCHPDLLDPTGPLHIFASSLDKVHFLEYLHDKIPPSLQVAEMCLANVHGLRFGTQLLEMLSHCQEDIMTVVHLEEWTPLKNNLPKSYVDMEDINTFMKFISDTENEVYDAICEPVTVAMKNCVSKAIPTLLYHIRRESEGCCTPFFDYVTAIVGEPDVFIVSFLEKFTSLICSIRTPGTNAVASERCGRILWNAFFGESVMQLMGTLLPSLMIPKEAACDAYSGKPFTTLLDIPYQFDTVIYGACAYRADEMTAFFANLPGIQNGILFKGLSDLFEDEKVLTGSQLVEWIEDFVGLVTDTTLQMVLEMVKDMKFHLSHGFADTCTFEETVSCLAWNPFYVPKTRFDAF